MLRSRVTPCLLVHNKGLVKTVKFKAPKYVGDPINAVKIFNEKEVDELIVLDIDASVENREPDYQMISNLAAESRMPLCYGGGIKTAEQAQKIIKLGVEKVALSSSVLLDFQLIESISSIIGKQSVVIVLDIKKNVFGKYEVYINNGKKKIKHSLEQIISKLIFYGIGELVVNSIDNDGVMKGFDLKLCDLIREKVDFPLTLMGGAGKAEDITNLIEKYKIIGVGVGSLFVFKGKYKAVLISYLARKNR